MQLNIFNQSGSTKTYLSGAISIPNASTLNVLSTTQQLSLATDGSLRSDLLLNNIYLTDGTNNFGNNDAISYLDTLIQTLGPLSDGFGNQIGSIVSAGVNNLLIAQGGTNYVLSTLNSTVAQLAASALFKGTIETVFNQQSYSILLTSDQPGTLTLNQYIDAAGTFIAASMSFSVLAGVPLARSGVVNGNFFNLSFLNTGGSTTTTLNINTAYGTIPSATQLNNAPTAINEINGTVFNLGAKSSTLSLPVVDIISTTSQSQVISLGAGTAVEAKGALSRLAGRKLLIITPTNGIIYWGTSSGVTSTTGMPIFKNQTLNLSFSDAVPVYIISIATTDIRILEAS